QENRDDYMPGSVGYQPTKQLVEVVAAIARYSEQEAVQTRRLVAMLPEESTKVGSFLRAMQLRTVLESFGVEIRLGSSKLREFGDDDARENIVPLTNIRLGPGGQPHFPTLRKLYE